MRAGLWLALSLLALCACQRQTQDWNDGERATIAALSLSQLRDPPADASNRYADDPRAAVFGEKLFFDTRLSRNGQLSCASCHQPAKFFSDGLPRAKGLGELPRHTPSLLGVAWNRWFFWDGRADSLWSQALGPLAHPRELGLSEPQLAALISQHHLAQYESLFGRLDQKNPLRVAVNIAKAIAAYERRLRPAFTRFDAYADALAQNQTTPPELFSDSERRGLKLFIGRGQCLRCHFSPLFTNHDFHNTGLASSPDRGRADGLRAALASGMNCRSAYSDDPNTVCPQLDYSRVGAAEWLGAFKTPSLRNVAATPPYMHDGRFKTLREVLVHYNQALGVNSEDGHTELFPLGLDAAQLDDLEAFLRTLGPNR